ncbi:MAG: hypothetical protein MI861_09640 [Pirellulales bacterium]|nr:hypothetical protein [Pirellulales bacterium]
MTHDDDALLVHYLTEQGYSWPEIERVIEKVNAHDAKIVRESVFDSIASGSFNLKAIIAEAIDELED